jgi:dipeptidyl aminopeptidase/acylaminoacyl peptidase
MEGFMSLLRILLVGSLLLVNLSWANPANIPVKDFFRNPEFSQLQLSPDGKYLATLAPMQGHRNIAIMETDGLKNPRFLTALDKQDIASFFWANNKDIVFTMDSDGNEAFGLYKISIEKKPRITTLVGSSISMGGRGIRTASVVHTLPDDPEHIIVQFNGRDIRAADLYLLPLDSRWNDRKKRNPKMELIAQNPGNVQSWILDHEGMVRGAYALEGMHGEFFYKEKNEEKFRSIRKFNILEESLSPLGFAFDDKTMYVASNIGRDKNAIYTYDPAKDKLLDLVFEHDEVDVSGLIMSRKQKKLLGVSYFDDYPRAVIFDEAERKVRESLSAAFKGKVVNISSMTNDESLNILTVWSDTDPGAYYLYNRKTGEVRYLAEPMHWLDENMMSPMKPIHFKSRDGLTLRGYVTIPKNSDGKKLPLIVNPHGGPFGVRDFWGFNQEHQFFASRGYAVVQVNYRGSGGYGREFEQAGYGGKWGAEMQNDITDTVNYLVKEGIADPDRVCIYGASYGGYATMAGLTFTPDLYKCGINYVGVTDVGLLFESMPEHWEPAKELMKVQIGDPEDKELMNRMSPLAHVDKIKAPLMIIQGAKDPRVVKEHALKLRGKLEERGIKLSDDEWIYKFNEGHGFRKEENRIELYTKMEKFLKKHLH